jgi:hypothetical protein
VDVILTATLLVVVTRTLPALNTLLITALGRSTGALSLLTSLLYSLSSSPRGSSVVLRFTIRRQIYQLREKLFLETEVISVNWGQWEGDAALSKIGAEGAGHGDEFG